MRWVFRQIRRLLVVVLGAVILLLSPAGYTELACQPTAKAEPYLAILPPEAHRPEVRTLLTYPEWHIVHAYDDYAQVIATGDPHDYRYLRAISGFWHSLCELTERSGVHGPISGDTKLMVYTIGVSFTAELLAKAAYEETLGRLAAIRRGPARAPLDDLSARQAADYAQFLQQVPWYKYDFIGDSEALSSAAGKGFRDRERAVALGAEYRAKSAYAGVIADAVQQVGPDELRLRMIVTGLSRADLTALPGVTHIADHPAGTEVETPRYRELTHLLVEMAAMGGEFVEIAGNDDILLTAISPFASAPRAVLSMPRQGYGDHRHLLRVKVPDLARTLRDLPETSRVLEHVHDY